MDETAPAGAALRMLPPLTSLNARAGPGEPNLVDCADVRIGMPVEVRFEPHGDVWVPVFASASSTRQHGDEQHEEEEP